MRSSGGSSAKIESIVYVIWDEDPAGSVIRAYRDIASSMFVNRGNRADEQSEGLDRQGSATKHDLDGKARESSLLS